MEFRIWLENNDELQQLVQSLEQQYPGLDLHAFETIYSVEVAQIKVPEELQGQGIGTGVIKAIQSFAQKLGKPIVVIPSPERGKKAALNRFYRQQGFTHNKGRNQDYRLSKPFGPTMYWKPKPE
jgi:GNAT superfamily N-acetyltransferase